MLAKQHYLCAMTIHGTDDSNNLQSIKIKLEHPISQLFWPGYIASNKHRVYKHFLVKQHNDIMMV